MWNNNTLNSGPEGIINEETSFQGCFYKAALE